MMKLSDPANACYALWIVWAGSWWLASGWSSRAQTRAGIARQLPYRLLTLAGFLLLFAINTRGSHVSLRLWRLPQIGRWCTVGLCVIGFAFAWWARLHLGKLWSAFVTRKADHHIIETGPYGIVRHPIYTGIILAALASAVLKGTLYAIAGALLVTIGFWIKARLEEHFLRQQLGAAAYDAYRGRVPMLLPLSILNMSGWRVR
jgi:protein-S-isoprenylcysteine O-methyltransferase Ste14